MNRILLFGMIIVSSFSLKTFADGHGQSNSIEFLNSEQALKSNFPFSQAVKVGNTLYLSGQIGIVSGEKAVVKGGVEAETKQTMENIKELLIANDYSMKDVVKCTVMLADIAEWGKFNQVYKTYFAQPFPARSAFGANGLALGARVEVECIAAKG